MDVRDRSSASGGASRDDSGQSLRIAVQMDPIESVDIEGDSTFVLMLEAERRGHRLYHYQVRDLWLDSGRLRVVARPVSVRRSKGDHFTLGPAEIVDLETMDVVLMRQDPPFDMQYITATHLLERIHPRTLVVNDPAGVRNAPEKLLVMDFPDLMPPTMITSSREAIARFREEHGDIIVKPLFGNGGTGVFRLRPDDENLGSLLDWHFSLSRDPLMIQRYEPAVRRGDKRIILIDGEPMGIFNRIPVAGDARSNMHAGGRVAACEMTERDREICARIGPTLARRGLLFAGIDVIGEYLTEINVTSPTGLQQVARFAGVHLEATIWDRIEAKIAAMR